MRTHSPFNASILSILSILVLLPTQASAAAPVALKASYEWNLAQSLVMDNRVGSLVSYWFSNFDNNTVLSGKIHSGSYSPECVLPTFAFQN